MAPRTPPRADPFADPSGLPDHYRLLGVGVRADLDEIKAAWRKLSRVYHPDRHAALPPAGAAMAEEAFKAIATAYAELSDPAKRLHYDRLLTLRDPLRLVDDPRAERALDVLDLVVNRLRKKPDALPGAKVGRDLRVVHKITLPLAALGGATDVRATYETMCRTCEGQGTTQPSRNPVCHACVGTGTLKVGLRRQEVSCGFCNGRGAVLLAPCATCAGRGQHEVTRAVQVTLPPRVRDGQVVRVRGAGEAPAFGGPAGDLVVEIKVARHPLLHLDGDDVVCTVPLRFAQAAGGTRLQVPTLEGPEWLTLPPGVTSGTVVRIAGRGLPGSKPGQRGVQRVVVHVDAPVGLSAAQLAALAAWDASVPSEAWAKVHAFAQAQEALVAAQ